MTHGRWWLDGGGWTVTAASDVLAGARAAQAATSLVGGCAVARHGRAYAQAVHGGWSLVVAAVATY